MKGWRKSALAILIFTLGVGMAWAASSRFEKFATESAMQLAVSEAISQIDAEDPVIQGRDVRGGWSGVLALSALFNITGRIAYLRDPNQLRSTYHRLKPVALKSVRAEGAGAKVKALTIRGLALLNDQVYLYVTELKTLEHERNEDYNSCQEKNGDKECRAIWSRFQNRRGDFLAEKNINEGDLYAREWIERRRAEGGDDLVRVWSEIVQDFHDSL